MKNDTSTNAFKTIKSDKVNNTQEKVEESEVHSLGRGIICDTEARGYATPRGKTELEILVNASEGFIALWAKNTTLRWRFRERSMRQFENPSAAKEEVRKLFGEALAAWGEATPVKFSEDKDVWDFEIVMRRADECDPQGCVLASAFFPDAGRHELVLYPRMFELNRKEQIDTFIHELGHVFGLRHFFAQLSETRWKSELFGTHGEFSIMNYGELSELSNDDKHDLGLLYKLVWSGSLTEINGTPIRTVKPYHMSLNAAEEVLAMVPRLDMHTHS